MKQSFIKAICPKCKKVRYIFHCTMFGFVPAYKCGKCGYSWKKEKNNEQR